MSDLIDGIEEPSSVRARQAEWIKLMRAKAMQKNLGIAQMRLFNIFYPSILAWPKTHECAAGVALMDEPVGFCTRKRKYPPRKSGSGFPWRKQECREMLKSLAVLTAVLVNIVVVSVASATGLEYAIPNCPHWVAAADDFFDECGTHARYFTRTFHPSGGARGEKEESSAWFASAPTDSHFVMGCVLSFDRSLRFLGLYYTMEPAAIAHANTAPIVGIGFNGDVVLSIDGHPVTFVAVRRFVTEKVKATRPIPSAIPLNCQSVLGHIGMYHTLGQHLSIDLSHFGRDGTIDVGSPNAVERRQFVELLSSPLPREVIYVWGSLLLVTTSGSVLVQTDWFPRVCHEGIPERVASSPLLIHQLCRLRQSN